MGGLPYTTFLVTFRCGHVAEREVLLGPGTQMVKERLQREAAQELCPACKAPRPRPVRVITDTDEHLEKWHEFYGQKRR